MASSLSSVVSNLVRASMGSAVSHTITDEDLDRHVAELILKDAKKKAERYGQHGIRAFLPSGGMSDSNAPRTNKRFLSSIIRSTDDHNKTILRAQALAAQEVKREREELERRERRARAEEAAEAERLRRTEKTYRRRRVGADEESWDHWDGRTADRKRKSRAWETWESDDNNRKDEDRDRHRPRSRPGSRERQKDRSKRSRHSGARDDVPSSSTRHRRNSSRNRSSKRAHTHDLDVRQGEGTSRLHSPEAFSARSRSTSNERDKGDPGADDYQRSRKHSSKNHRRSRRSRRRLASGSRERGSPPPSSRREDPDSHGRRRSRSPKYALDEIETDDSARSRGHSSQFTRSPDIDDREAELRRKLAFARKNHRPVAGPSKDHNHTSTSVQSSSPGSDALLECRRARSSSSLTAMTRSISRSRSRSRTPGPDPAVQLPSKMDKYFKETYDPRLDVAPLTAPKVPATGLINNADFEGWDAMLELIRIRREDKEEKKRMERLGLTKEKVKDKKLTTTSDSVGDRWSAEGVSIMEIEYKKRGSVREWDLGKEGF